MTAWQWAGFALVLAWLGWALVEPTLLRVKRYHLRLPGWPADYPGLRIASLSDLHMGMPHMTMRRLRDIVERTNALRPDLILLGGDYIDRKAFPRSRLSLPEIATELGGLNAPLGTFAVLGNHDRARKRGAVRRELERAGIVVLENEARATALDDGRFWVAGLADLRLRKPDIPATLGQITDDAPVLLVVHNPVIFFDVPDRPMLTLCGHTHGGQMTRLPFLGAILIMSYAPLKWAYGHVVEQGRHLLVTGGIGTSSLPLRFLMRPEIVVIEITSR